MKITQHCERGVITAHAMNTATGGSRSGAEIDTRQRCPIRSEAENWARDELPQIRGATVNVAAGQIPVRSFKIDSIEGVTGQNAIAKTRRESLDLPFDPLRHVDVASERHVSVGPERIFAGGRACGVEETLLRNEHKRTLRNFSARNVAFSHGDFIECAA